MNIFRGTKGFCFSCQPWNKITFLLSVYVFFLTPFASEARLQSLSPIFKLWGKEQAQLLQVSQVDRYYQGQSGTKNYYTRFQFPENFLATPLIIITGLEDPVPDWFDVVLLARDYGFQKIYIIELRGQGQSEKEHVKRSQMIHVNSFTEYYNDLIAAFKNIDQIDGFEKPVYIISHSTGSLVLTSSLLKMKKEIPNINIRAMSFWAPLFKLKLSPFLNNSLVRPLLALIDKVYQLCCGVIAGTKFSPKNFKDNKVTTDYKNFQRSQDLKFKYGLGSAGVSLAWGLAAIEATSVLMEKYINELIIPTLVLIAENDTVVSNDFEVTSKAITVKRVPKAKHALHIEKKDIVRETFDQTMKFFTDYKPEF